MADSPKEGEAAQALFCAIVNSMGKTKADKEFDLKKYPNYKLFKKHHEKEIEKALSNVDTPSITLEQIEKFLETSDGWYESSMNIAKKIVDDITDLNSKFKKIQGPKWQDVFYVRGAAKDKNRSPNAMESIGYLFDVANGNEKYFGDINKWSPADIYFVSKKAESVINEEIALVNTKAKKAYNFLDLNKLVVDLFESGDLLPLSLKKAEKEVHIVPVNFSRDEEEKYLSEIKYYGVSDWSKKYTRKTPITRDIKIYASKDKKEKIKIRHDPYSANYGVNKAVKAEIEVSGAGGRGGSVVGIPLISQLIAKVDPKFATELTSAFNTGIKKYATEIEKTNKQFKVQSGSKLKSPAKEDYDEERAILSGLYVSNAIMPVIYEWFKKNESNEKTAFLNDKVLQKFMEYTSSRTEKSGLFVIAK